MLTVNALHGYFEEFGESLRKDRLMSTSRRQSASIRVRGCLKWFSIQERFSGVGLDYSEHCLPRITARGDAVTAGGTDMPGSLKILHCL